MEKEKVIHKQALVCFLDILGFRKLIQEKDVNEVINIYHNMMLSVGRVHSRENVLNRMLGNSQAKKYPLELRVTSDSIILWCKEMNPLSFAKILAQTELLLFAGLCCGLPLRGAITVGDLAIININNKKNEPILLGSSITKAFDLEKKQEWSGCVISDECIKLYESFGEMTQTTIKDIIQSNHMSIYDVPIKNNEVAPSYVVDWRHLFEQLPKYRFEDLMNPFGFNLDENARQKIFNTETFLKLKINP